MKSKILFGVASLFTMILASPLMAESNSKNELVVTENQMANTNAIAISAPETNKIPESNVINASQNVSNAETVPPNESKQSSVGGGVYLSTGAVIVVLLLLIILL